MKIFFGVYNYFQNPHGCVAANKYNFYKSFIEELRTQGHEVLCVDCKWGKNKTIPESLVKKLELYKPDLCILGNYGFWSLFDFVECPICFMDIDSISDISTGTMYRIRNYIERCYFISQNDKTKELIKEKFNASSSQIISINLFAKVSNKIAEKVGDIVYFGDNFVQDGCDFLNEFNKIADKKEKEEAKSVLYDFIQNPTLSDRELYDRHQFFSFNRVNLSPQSAVINEILGLEKIKRLSHITDLGLTVMGSGWTAPCMSYYPELIGCINGKQAYNINEYQDEVSKYKISLIFDNGPFCKGDILRLLESVASDSCVVVQYSDSYKNIIEDLGLLSFENADELRKICVRVLENEEYRLQQIESVHKKLRKSYSAFKAIRDFEKGLGLKTYIARTEGSLIVKKESELVPPVQVMSPQKKAAPAPKKQEVNKTPTKPIAKKPSQVKVFFQKALNRLFLFFGYDRKNLFPKKTIKIWRFILFEVLHYSKDIDRIYILSLPILEIKKKGNIRFLHLAFFTQIIENIKKINKFLKIRFSKKNNPNDNKPKPTQGVIKPIRALLRKKMARGEKIKICLFVSRITCWIYTDIYDILKKSTVFDPIVVVKPFMFQGMDAMKEYMETTYSALAARGYNVVRGYDDQTGQFLDVRKVINPDIVFYTKYWPPQFQENFYIKKFEDKLTFYTSYCFDIAYHPVIMNFELNNKVDRYFMPTMIHKKMAQEVMDNHASNVYVVGAPKLDVFFNKEYQPKDVWKKQEKRKKRIIWAPHHSDNFPGNLYQFNAFYELTDFMFEMAEKYKDDIQIAFKPHPMLKPYLVSQKWGKTSADAYYDKWANLENGQLETGEFIDLFLTSDAMILDSISFIAEYTATNKPAFFTIGSTSRVQLNEFGSINYEVLYHTENGLKEDIEKFIVDVVINGNDVKKEERTAFVQKYLLPPNGKTSAENIYDNIIDEIQNGDKK